MPALTVLIGAVTPPGRLYRAVGASLGEQQIEAEVTLLSDYDLGFADGRPVEDRADDSSAFAAAVTASRALLVASPVYHGWVPGALKNALDLLPRGALSGMRCGVLVQGNDESHAERTAEALADILRYLGAESVASPERLLDGDFVDGAPTPSARGRVAALLRRVVANS